MKKQNSHEGNLGRRLSQLMLAVAAFVLVFATKGVTAKAADDIWQTAQNGTSITINWRTPDLYSGEYVKKYYIGWGTDYETARNMMQAKTHTVDANTHAFTITGLNPGIKYEVYVGYTTVYHGYDDDDYFSGEQVRTTPGVVTGINQKDWYRVIHSVDIEWNSQSGADGYIFKFMKEDGTVIETQDESYNSFSHSIDNNRIYKGTCQAYADINGQRYYGPVSPTAYFMTQPAKKDARELGGKIKKGVLNVNWEKVKGITKYNVYVATERGGDFKKVKTVSAKKKSVNIKKVGGKKIKKNRTYYVYVEGVKKVGDNTYTTGLLYITPISKKGTKEVIYSTSWKFRG
jgi:hypothetical protein